LQMQFAHPADDGLPVRVSRRNTDGRVFSLQIAQCALQSLVVAVPLRVDGDRNNAALVGQRTHGLSL
jgi:hypothetical protein